MHKSAVAGRVWVSVGSEWAAPERPLTATILALNDAVRDGFLAGAPPQNAFKSGDVFGPTATVARMAGPKTTDARGSETDQEP